MRLASLHEARNLRIRRCTAAFRDVLENSPDAHRTFIFLSKLYSCCRRAVGARSDGILQPELIRVGQKRRDSAYGLMLAKNREDSRRMGGLAGSTAGSFAADVLLAVRLGTD